VSRTTAGPRLTKPLRERDFALLWSGRTVSLVGDGFTDVALAWQTYTLSPHAAALSVVFLARSLPRIALLLVGGVVGDRLSRRLVLVSADVLRGAAVGLIAILGAAHALHLWHLAVMAAVFGVGDAFFFPASTAILPEVLPKEQLVAGNALNSASHLLAEHLTGPALGGVVIALVGTAGAFGADAASFAVSAACLLAMRTRPAPREAPSQTIRAEIREGFRYVRSKRWILVTLIAAGADNFLLVGPLIVLVPLLVKATFHAGAEGLGLVYAANGLGGGIAAVALGRRALPRRFITTMYAVWVASCIGLAGVGLVDSVWAAAAVMIPTGLTNTAGNLIWETLIQRLVPRTFLARVSSMDWLLSLGLTPLSYAVVAPVAAVVGVRTTIVATGILAAVVTLLLGSVSGVRDPEQEPATEEARQSVDGGPT
jgi:DHA3 family tetracycline resistance protein-like MFS transporter